MDEPQNFSETVLAFPLFLLFLYCPLNMVGILIMSALTPTLNGLWLAFFFFGLDIVYPSKLSIYPQFDSKEIEWKLISFRFLLGLAVFSVQAFLI